MKSSFRAWSYVLAVVALVSVAGASVEDLVRKGNAAFERGEYELAVQLYEQAETWVTDPGLVAFNKAAALYQLGEFAPAAEHYARALEDAAGVRRVKALYGLGNAQVRQGQAARVSDAVRVLQLALRNYGECLQLENKLEEEARLACAETFDHARANAEIAQQLLAKKKAEQAQHSSNTDNGSSQQPDRAEDEPGSGDSRTPRGNGRKPSPWLRKPDPAEAGAISTEQQRPGQGNLPTQLDGGVRLESGQALEHLQEAMMRLRRDRSRALQAVIEGTGVRDW